MSHLSPTLANMPPRYDFSAIGLLDSYAAKQCPVRVQLDVLQPGKPVPMAEDALLRIEQGNEFESSVVATLQSLAGPGWVFVDEVELSADERRAATVRALGAQVPVIVGANLAADFEEKRSGKPDMLVRHEVGYVPIDIKHHMTLDGFGPGPPSLVSELCTPFPDAAWEDPLWQRRRHKGDALQLAHYRRMLEAAGHSAAEALGGIIGKEGRLVWYRLDEPLWTTAAESGGKKQKKRTTLEVYDFEFDFRRDIAAIAQTHLTDPDVDLLVEPVLCPDCAACPWRDVCQDTLFAGSGDASLLPGVSYRQWRALRNVGVTDRSGVAGLDLPTAELLVAGVDATWWLDAASAIDPQTPVGQLRPNARKQIATLDELGIATAADVVDYIDPQTAQLDRWAPAAIVNARAAVGPAAVYRLPGGVAGIPRADIEIDVDMENTNDGVYQWGVVVTDRAATGLVATGYRAFITWDPITPEVEQRVFAEFWNWLNDVRHRAAASGHGVRAYCWHENAENTQMLRITAADADRAAEVRSFIDSSDWVDMLQVFRAGWTTGGSTGLKKIAPLAGFEWDVDDPGGGVSMLYHAWATDPDHPRHAEARQWLLDYNRGDVEATLAIREWLDGSDFPEVPPAPD